MALSREQLKAKNALSEQDKVIYNQKREEIKNTVVQPEVTQEQVTPKPIVEKQTGTPTTPKNEQPVVKQQETTPRVENTQQDDITYQEDAQPFSEQNVISKAEQFQGTDGNTYQTVRNSDNTLTTIDTKTGQAVTGKYTDDQRQQIKESFLWQEQQTDPNMLFSSLQTGQYIAPQVQNTPEYQQAYNRYANLNMYSAMSSSDLANAIQGGQFLPWTTAYNDLKNQNPQLVADAERQQSINSINQPTKEVQDMQTMISEYLTKLMTPEETQSYSEVLSGNKNVIELNKSLTQSAEQMAEYKDQLEYSVEDFRKDIWDRTVTSWYASYKVWERTREITRAYNLELAKYNATAGQLQTISENIKYEMESEAQRKQNELANMWTAIWLYQDLTADERALELNQKQLEQQYQYTYGDLNSEDPTLQNIAIQNAVAGMYQNYPLPWMESQATKVQKVQNLIAQGMTGSEAIAQVESEIRNSQRYKDYIASQSPQAETQKPFTVSAWSSVYDPATWEFKSADGNVTSWGVLWDLRGLAWDYPWQAWAKNNNPAWITWNNNFETWKGTAALFDEAGINYTKWTSRPAAEWGNYVTFATMEDWLAAQRILMSGTYWKSTVGDMLQSWVGTSEWPSYAQQVAWNAGIDTGVKVSDLSELELAVLQSAKIQKESPWLYDLLLSSQEINITERDIQTYNSTTFKPQSDLKTPQDKAKYDKYLEMRWEVFDNKDADIQEIMNYSAWGGNLTDTSIKSLEKFNSALAQIWEINSQIGEMKTWPIIWKLKWLNPYDTDAQTLKASLTALIPNLARGVYGEVWVLTDNDVRLYSQTIPNLTSTQDTNKAVLAMTLKVVAWGYKRQLQSLAAAWKDVSWFSWIYENLMGQVDSIETELWIKDWVVNNQTPTGWQSVQSPSWNVYTY